MIHYLTGNIFDSDAAALVNTVNTVGIMGKGVALQFKNRYPNNYHAYQRACKNGDIAIGKLLVVSDGDAFSNKLIINFPTKTDWRQSSEITYIEQGLVDLRRIITQYNIRSIALPPLGSGNGGLDWVEVKKRIEQYLTDLNDVDIYVYEPSQQIREYLRKERVALTPARAMLLAVLYDLVSQGEYVSEFSSEKVCYFLQCFGAGKYFNLKFNPCYYGPYSGKVRYVLNALNGSYIMGYSAMDKKPFEPLSLLPDAYQDVINMINSNEEYKLIVNNTKQFLQGYYSDYCLELLSSVDYLMKQHHDVDLNIDDIHSQLALWSERKNRLFDNAHIATAKQHINQFKFA